jgi:hypothetical protein
MDDKPVNLAEVTRKELLPVAIERLTRIVSSGSTHAEGESVQTVLRCAWYPLGDSPSHECDGRIRTVWRNTDQIPRVSWSCSHCDRQGVVYGWADSGYDERSRARAPDCPTHVVPLGVMDAIDDSAGIVFHRAVLEPRSVDAARTWATHEDIDEAVWHLAEFLEYYADRPDMAIDAYRALSELAGRADPAAEAVRLMDQIEATVGVGRDRPRFAELELHAFAHPDATREAIGPRIAALRRPAHDTQAHYLQSVRERLGM